MDTPSFALNFEGSNIDHSDHFFIIDKYLASTKVMHVENGQELPLVPEVLYFTKSRNLPFNE